MTVVDEDRAGILSRPYALTTVGSWSLIFLAAFESLAVTTIMPVVTADLDGRAFYALAFSATLAAGVIGMVLAGGWADGRGPARPLLTAIALFALGLALAGAAPSMAVFVAGRFLQGLGAGGITVSLYVLIAAVYPPSIHIKIFGAYASAWVLPSMVGPFVAGVVADALSWHWVFLGVVALVVVATAMIVPALRGHGRDSAAVIDVRRLASAVVLAVAVVALSSAVELDGRVAWPWPRWCCSSWRWQPGRWCRWARSGPGRGCPRRCCCAVRRALSSSARRSTCRCCCTTGTGCRPGSPASR